MTTRNSRGTTLAIVQARMSSTRLPGKVLAPVAGEPMIVQQLRRVARAERLDGIVVAVPADPGDDDLASVVADTGVDVVRGVLNDVLDRYMSVLATYDADVIVRLTADCPLVSPTVIDDVISAFHDSQADYVSNTMAPTYPDGLDVEVVTAEVLRKVASISHDSAEREHVTLGVYRRPEMFIIENFSDPTGRDNSQMRWTVDNAEDLEFVRWAYASLTERPFDYPEILELLELHPDRIRTGKDAKRNAALDGLDTGVMQHRQSGATS